MVKKYESINNLHLVTTVKVDGKDREIRFRGGTLTPRKNGTFATDDEQLQKAMESDSGYNVSFRELVVDKKKEDSLKNSDKAKEPEVVELIDVFEVRTLEMAYSWFLDNLSLFPRTGLKYKQIIKIANTHGYHFPNLEEKPSQIKVIKRV
ncbi:MAG: hypothetical protein R3Y50_05230 [Rikenellaceae bacterium]